MTALAKLDERANADLAQVAAKYALAVLGTARAYGPLVSQTDADETTELVAMLRGAMKAIEATRDQFVKPLREIASAQVKVWKKSIDPYAEAIRIHCSRLSEYDLDRREYARAAIEAASAPEEVAAAVAIAAPTQGRHTRTYYHAEVVDFDALPAEFKLPDQRGLDALAAAKKGDFSVPGCKLVVTKKTVVR